VAQKKTRKVLDVAKKIGKKAGKKSIEVAIVPPLPLPNRHGLSIK